ncbi:type II secretion system F family protein [Clostridium sp. MSJ-4]|uniref:Type II secretion system F family protein n=1 Tax=Clostridium simiarum TaxID=2841506 RepID=A0ABS6EX18_9CLOT|nr:type II secretion system F family protein [Clostridium simiarum]MBU5590772.1 type II secretion system F family protein [Clostridium simiarum]
MNKYYYKAYDLQGKKKFGRFIGEKENLRSVLKGEGYYLCKYYKSIDFKDLLKKPSYKDLGILCQNLSIMLRSGVNIFNSLNIISHENQNIKIKESILGVCVHLKDGKSLSDSFSQYSQVYPKIFIQMIKVGEESGNLENSFDTLSKYYYKQEKLKEKLKNSLSYPIILLLSTIMMFFFITVQIVPSFINLLDETLEGLPIYTKAFITMSNLIIDKWYVILAISLLLLLMICINYKNNNIKYGITMRIKILRDFYNIKFVTSLKTLITSGNTIINSLERCADIIDNPIYKKNIDVIISDIKSGKSLCKAFKKSNLLNSISLSILEVGEESGNLEESLNYIEDILMFNYEKNIEKKINRIQPMSIIIIGSMVLILIIILVLPMMDSLTSLY